MYQTDQRQEKEGTTGHTGARIVFESALLALGLQKRQDLVPSSMLSLSLSLPCLHRERIYKSIFLRLSSGSPTGRDAEYSLRRLRSFPVFYFWARAYPGMCQCYSGHRSWFL